jgi:hypothetical protein
MNAPSTRGTRAAFVTLIALLSLALGGCGGGGGSSDGSVGGPPAPPPLAAGTAEMTLSDGTTITLDSAGAGTDFVYATNLQEGSANAPRGTLGLHMRCLTLSGNRVLLGIRNTGRKFPGAGIAVTPANAGQPVYFSRLIANMPGRVVPYGAKYRSVRDLGGGNFLLIDPTDPKTPELTAWMNQDPTAYARSTTEHMLPGGYEIFYLFVPASDPIEQMQEPTPAARAQALQLIDINTETLAAYPFALAQIENYEHDALQDDPGLPRWQTKESWLMSPENVQGIATSKVVIQGASGAEKLKTWCTGMAVFTPQTGFNTNGHYGGNAWWMVRYLLEPSTKYDSFARGLGLLRQSIACGMYRCDAPCKHKDRMCPEGIELDGTATGFVHQRGSDTGWTEPSYEKEWDLALVLGRMLRPDDALIADAFSRRLAVWLALPVTTSPSSLAGDLTCIYGSRRYSAILHNLMWFYRYHVITGDLVTADLVKAKADTLIEAIYSICHMSPATPAPRWIVHTNNPAANPNNAGDLNISGAGEGFWHITAKWIVDCGTNPTRLQWVKDGVEWMLLNTTQVYAPGKRRLAYRWIPNLTGGSTFPYCNDTPISIDYASNSTLQQAHILGLEPYVQLWFGGAYDSYFMELKEAVWNDHNDASNTGALAFDDTNWPKLHRMKVQHLMLAHIGG